MAVVGVGVVRKVRLVTEVVVVVVTFTAWVAEVTARGNVSKIVGGIVVALRACISLLDYDDGEYL